MANFGVKIESSQDLAGMKLHELTGPDYWAYEQVEPHYYVIEKDGLFFAFWEDKETYDMINSLLTGEMPTKLMAPSMDELIDRIDECYSKEG